MRHFLSKYNRWTSSRLTSKKKKAKASVGRIEATDAAIAPGTPGTWSSSQRIAWSVAHDARVRCAVSKGAMLGADKLAKDLRGLAVWIGAGQLHRVLEAQATRLYRVGGAAFSKTGHSPQELLYNIICTVSNKYKKSKRPAVCWFSYFSACRILIQ